MKPFDCAQGKREWRMVKPFDWFGGFGRLTTSPLRASGNVEKVENESDI
jgi:hypothetical protein